MRRFAEILARLTGWRRAVVCVVLGITAALSLPPLYFAPALIIAFTGLIWIFDGAVKKRSAFAVGWWFGFGYFAISLYWVGFALFVEADKYAWLLPFAAMGLPAGLAIFSGLATLLTFVAIRRLGLSGFSRVLALAVSWTLFEWLRGNVLTGFPWNLTGYSWGVSDALLQGASVVGVHGLGLMTVIIAASPAALADDVSRPKRWSPLLACGLLLVVTALWGQHRLQQNPTSFHEGVNLRLVQPALAQEKKWLREYRQIYLERYLALSSAPAEKPISLLIWPETAVPYFLDRDPSMRQKLGDLLPPNGLLLTGIPRTTATPRKPGTAFKIWNSVQVLNAQGQIISAYDKHHLVPFGEYVPLRSVLGLLGIERLAAGRGDFLRGQGPETLVLPGYPSVGPLICYEVIFPGEVVSKENRPQWMLNVTNDAWFGMSAGPWQHLAIAVMRSVEEGLPMVRAANSGVSAIIDPMGRIINQMGLGDAGVLDGVLPTALGASTIYGRYGDLGLAIMICLAIGLILVVRNTGTTRLRK